VVQLPHDTAGPQPLLTWPQVRVPQVGGVHAVHVPETHSLLPLHFDGQVTLPLPHAFFTVPHDSPPSADVHSGGVAVHSPAMHCCPLGHEQAIVWPHPSVTVPQSAVCAVGVQVRVGHWPASGGGPASFGTQVLFTHDSPAPQAPQLIPTPHASLPTMPHLPVHVFGWQVCDVGSFGVVRQIRPPSQAEPHWRTLPVHGSV
jgi:hypothetical protein